MPAAIPPELLSGDIGAMLKGAIASGVAIGGPLVSGYLLHRFKVAKYMPLIRRTFEIIDPILAEYMRSYGPSDVRFLIELVTRALADGELSREETRFVYDEIIKRYSPVKAAATGYRALLDEHQEVAVIEAVKKQMELPLEERIYNLSDAVAAVRAEIQERMN